MRQASQLALDAPADERAVYDVVLLAGSPRRYTLELSAALAEGSVIDVDGEQWIVADVRAAAGSPSQLICIYAR